MGEAHRREVTRIQNKDLILGKEREKGLQRAFSGNLGSIFYAAYFFILSQFTNKITLIEKELLFRLLMGKSGYT